MYPAYNDVRNYKPECEPSDIFVSKKVCSVSMNSSLNHFLDRLLQIPSIREKVTTYAQDSNFYVWLISKYGGDGFSTKTFYKGLDFDQRNIFAVTCVPVMIKALNKTTKKSIPLWINSRANSPFACRPLHYEFMREEKEKSNAIGTRYMEEAKNLLPYFDLGGFIGHEAFACLLDGLYYYLTFVS